MERTVFFISDRTGITAETLGHSLLTQFPGVAFRQRTARFIDTPDKASAMVAEINRVARDDGARPIVFSTLIDPQIREIVAGSEGAFFDFVDTFIQPLEVELRQSSSHTIGHTHGLVDRLKYNLRMDAVNYTLATDDGQTTKNYSKADVIILGVSRSGKTPTCLYLALNFGIYAANYPLTEEDLGDLRLPAALATHRQRLYGLTIEPERLQQIRRERKPEGRYATLKQCQYEVRQAEALYRQEGLPYLDTSTISIEEIATTILHQMGLQQRLDTGQPTVPPREPPV